MLDALVSHLYVIYWSEREGVKAAASTSGTVTPTKNNSASSPSEFIPPSPESSSTTAEVSKATDETKTIPATTNDELVKELMTKALNALETIKECVL